MYRTKHHLAPIITFLSPSVSASKRATFLLSTLGKFETTSVVTDDNINSGKRLNDTFKSIIPGFACSWESIGARDIVSGSIIHFINVANSQNRNQNIPSPFALIAITDTDADCDDGNNETKNGAISSSSSNLKVDVAIKNARCLLASRINEGGMLLKRTSLILKYFLRGILTVDDLLKNCSPDGLPLLSIPTNDKYENSGIVDKACIYNPSTNYLKEVVIPYFDYAAYKDGSTFVSKLCLAKARKRTVGVYEWPNINNEPPTTSKNTCIRPLPMAGEDQTLPSPSLIFHCDDPEIECSIRENGFRKARIGYGGCTGRGQVMLLHNDLIGIDIRYCPRTSISSAFSESQESLLAGSIEELQSKNILIAVGEEGKEDERILNGDCWVEERAKLKRPLRFFDKSKTKNSLRRAKVPDIPYE